MDEQVSGPYTLYKAPGATTLWYVHDKALNMLHSFNTVEEANRFVTDQGLARPEWFDPFPNMDAVAGNGPIDWDEMARDKRELAAVREELHRTRTERGELLERLKRMDVLAAGSRQPAHVKTGAMPKPIPKLMEDMGYRVRRSTHYGWDVRVDMNDGGTWCIWRPTRQQADNAGYRRLKREVERRLRAVEAEKVHEMTWGELRGISRHKEADRVKADLATWEEQFNGQA